MVIDISNIKCVIFDFDHTLFDSTPLDKLRIERKWYLIYEKLKHCNFHYGAVNLLCELNRLGVKTAIVSNAPESYIKKALLFHQVKIDFLIAYHDVKNHKPFPDGILQVLRHFLVSNKQIIYIGDNDIDYETAANANVKFIGVEWGVFQKYNPTRINFQNLL